MWAFGDGGGSMASSPGHTYRTQGVYTVALTVARAGCSNDTYTIPNYIAVSSCVSDRVRVDANYWHTLQDAYSLASDADVIEMQALEFIENVIFNRPVSVTVQGGFTCDYLDVIPETILKGSLTVIQGSTIIEGLTIQ